MFGFVFFVALFLAGEYISARFALPIPGSIIGLGLAFCILLVRGRVDSPLKQASDTFARYLPLMLVPIGVAGVVRLVESPPAGAWRLILVLVLALIAGAMGTGKIIQAALQLYKSMSPAQASPESACSQDGEV